MEKEFTLIELLAVIAIFSYNMIYNTIENSKKQTFMLSLSGLYSAVNE